jgi:hypothetical protein
VSAETFSILHPRPHSADVPLPVRFHISEELFKDEAITAEFIADLLHDDLVLAIRHHRESA